MTPTFLEQHEEESAFFTVPPDWQEKRKNPIPLHGL